LKVVIIQPAYAPWLGYLAQMAEADVFVCLDDVQFNRKYWQSRNRIISRTGEVEYIEVKTKKSHLATLIKDILIADDYDQNLFIEKIRRLYSGLEGVDYVFEHIVPIYTEFYKQGCLLAESNFKQLLHIKELLGFNCTILKASDMQLNESRTATQRLLNICKELGAKKYLATLGARTYMEQELNIFPENNIQVLWQSFQHQNYLKNQDKRFVSHLSYVDFLIHNDCKSLPSYLSKCNSYFF